MFFGLLPNFLYVSVLISLFQNVLIFTVFQTYDDFFNLTSRFFSFWLFEVLIGINNIVHEIRLKFYSFLILQIKSANLFSPILGVNVVYELVENNSWFQPVCCFFEYVLQNVKSFFVFVIFLVFFYIVILSDDCMKNIQVIFEVEISWRFSLKLQIIFDDLNNFLVVFILSFSNQRTFYEILKVFIFP